jgi:hypothetical protein
MAQLEVENLAQATFRSSPIGYHLIDTQREPEGDKIPAWLYYKMGLLNSYSKNKNIMYCSFKALQPFAFS